MSAPLSVPTKTCAACGADCSNRPRIKDPSGRYFCKECYEKTPKRAASTRGSAPGAASPAPTLGAAPAAGADTLDLLSQLSAKSSDAPSVEVERAGCPSCGKPLVGNAVMCIHCGYHLQLQRKLSAKPVKSATGALGGSSASLARLAANPAVFAGASLLLFLVVFLLARGDESMMPVYLAVAVLYGLGVTIFLLIKAFQESVVSGILCLVLWPYALYYALVKTDSTHLKLAYVVSIVSFALLFALPGLEGVPTSE